MSYRQFRPHRALANYIDAYWTVKGDGGPLGAAKILPDGCVDIIFNLGNTFDSGDGSISMQHEKAYLVGTMTRFKETLICPDTNLLGVRFKPAAFSSFFKFGSLHEITDQTIELERRLHISAVRALPDLDRFFLDKLPASPGLLAPVIADIRHHRGQISVSALTQRHFITGRQLERLFKQHIGVSPKEFINITRYQSAMDAIRNNTSGRSLLDIAFDCGYYDHAHLTNEIRRYTGVAPSLL